MNEPDIASDYQERDVKAAYSVLIELGQVLGAWRKKFVIVGGAVPWLLLGEARPKHIGTLDIDLDLNPDALAGRIRGAGRGLGKERLRARQGRTETLPASPLGKGGRRRTGGSARGLADAERRAGRPE